MTDHPESTDKASAKSGFAAFWAELKRRKVVRVAVTYAIVAWIVIQIAAVTFPTLFIPDWALRLVTMCVLLGFPVALILAWAFELTPEGIKVTKSEQEITEETEDSKALSKKRNRLSLLFAAAIPTLIFGTLALYFFVRSGSLTPDTRHLTPGLSESDKSIAVLPLVNMSPDPDNAFFADGVHEDVLTNLSKIKELHVIGRTSTLQYRDTIKTLQQIGEELNVRYLLEGSVRRARNRVLVTVQLIDAQNEGHLWAENYSRELDDIFAIQADIAKAIAGQLQAVISPEEIEKIEYRPTESTEAYDAYVQARLLRVTRGPGAGPQRVGLLEQAVALDPDFGEAWYLLAVESLDLGNTFLLNRDPSFDNREDRLDFAQKALRETERLMPNTPELLYAQSEFMRREGIDVQEVIKRLLEVLAIDPDFRDANYSLGNRYRNLGRYTEAVHYLEATLRKDPIQGQTFRSLALLNMRIHNWEKASYYLRQRANAFQSAFGGEGAGMNTSYVDRMIADYLEGAAQEPLLRRVKDADFDNPWMWYFICGDASGVLENTAPERLGASEYVYLTARRARWANALAYRITGDDENARKLLIEMAETLPATRRLNFGNRNQRDLGMVYAVLGNEEKTAEIFEGLLQAPREGDTEGKLDTQVDRAIALAWLGKKDDAVAELDRLIKEPSMLNVHFMRHSLDFWPLRDHPGFQAILDDPANNQQLPPEKL